jgi:filamentous hemagglutinin family protein
MSPKILVSILALGLLHSPPTLAQISPDQTLPNPSVVMTTDSTSEITGGTIAGGNLFHSFRQFSVRTGETAAFQNATTVQNIITRITGNSVSRIDGLIQAKGNANLFLLNPNGIIFGRNAALDIGGSFLATTGDRLTFDDGTEFSTADTENALLTVSVPNGIQFGLSPGSIRTASTNLQRDTRGNPLLDEDGNPIIAGLRVGTGRTLALVGGRLTFPGGVLTVEGGRIELGSVGANSQVRFTALNSLQPEQGWELDYAKVSQFQDMEFNGAAIDASGLDLASGLGGGSIQLQGRRIDLTHGTLILSDTKGNQSGEDIGVRSAELTLSDASVISASLNSNEDLRSGDIQIQTNRLLLQSEGQVSILANGAAGRSGVLSVSPLDRTAESSIELTGGRVRRGFWDPSGLFNQIRNNAREGQILVTTDRLALRDGAQIQSTANGRNNAGAVRVEATTIDIEGSAINNGRVVTDETGFPFGSGLFSDTQENSSGNGGLLTVITDQLNIRDGGAIQTSTKGAGDAGDLIIHANRIEVVGRDRYNRFPSGILTLSGGIPGTKFPGLNQATGRGGNLTLTTDTLRVRDGAIVATGSFSRLATAKGAGDLTLNAQRVSLDQTSGLFANSNSGNGGDLRLQIQDLLLLQRNSQISTTAGLAGTGGNGGNIRINTDFIVAAPTANNDITANAFEGNGGNVDIAANIIGITPRDRLTAQSDITATSERGVSGTITLSNLEIDPTRGITELQSTPVDAAQLIAQGCSRRSASGDSTTEHRFIVSGRGGLPLSPDSVLRSPAVVTGWISAQVQPVLSPPNLSPYPEIDDWTVDERGTVKLIARTNRLNAANDGNCPGS